MNNILKANQLSKTFNAKTIPVNAVKEVNIEIREGEITVLTGRSGSGKSTLLHLLAGLEQKTSGTIFYKNQSYDDLNSKKLTELRRSDMGFVYQFHYLLNELTAIENVSLPLLMNNYEKKEALEKSKEILNTLGLSHRFSHKPSEMSGGEKQRVAIARSMVHSPSLVILDEPTGDLDSKTSLDVIESLKNYVKDIKSSLLIATHDENFKEISDQTLIMDSGII
ncbi:MAG: ABC transporter ATP-binding protein [Gammaproteobacteria bacterium]|tara:strand:- start:11108 stop:11776 length:669 start_codon:yes stop_codon:yes gene_type:complete